MADRIIKFVWHNITYVVKKPGNPILLPTGEVLVGDGWQKEITPRHPGNLECLFIISKVFGIKRADLVSFNFDFNLADAVNFKQTLICPKGCQGMLTHPFCNQCGSETEIIETISHLKFEPKSPIDKEGTVTKDMCCPNCDTYIGSESCIKVCSVCGLRLDFSY